jgi:hypothetical protein
MSDFFLIGLLRPEIIPVIVILSCLIYGIILVRDKTKENKVVPATKEEKIKGGILITVSILLTVAFVWLLVSFNN